MSTHTPGPWRNDNGLIRSPFGAIAGIVYSSEDDDPINYTTAHQNAAFIVRACNAHEDLLAAARNLLNASRLVGVLGVTEVSIAEEGLEKIITKAEGRAYP